MFGKAFDPARTCVRQIRFTLLLLLTAGVPAAVAAPAIWIPDPPNIHRYQWHYQPCPGCRAIDRRAEWAQMAALAHIPAIRFLASDDESNGPAYSYAPNVVVLTPSAMHLDRCQQTFVIGHELAHIALHHFDEVAVAASIFAGAAKNWTDDGAEAVHLVDSDFALALKISHLWQQQEFEADWVGSLLAAQTAGCTIEAGAIAYFSTQISAGGGVAAAHPGSRERIRRLQPFIESARRLAKEN